MTRLAYPLSAFLLALCAAFALPAEPSPAVQAEAALALASASQKAPAQAPTPPQAPTPKSMQKITDAPCSASCTCGCQVNGDCTCWQEPAQARYLDAAPSRSPYAPLYAVPAFVQPLQQLQGGCAGGQCGTAAPRLFRRR